MSFLHCPRNVLQFSLRAGSPWKSQPVAKMLLKWLCNAKRKEKTLTWQKIFSSVKRDRSPAVLWPHTVTLRNCRIGPKCRQLRQQDNFSDLLLKRGYGSTWQVLQIGKEWLWKGVDLLICRADEESGNRWAGGWGRSGDGARRESPSGEYGKCQWRVRLWHTLLHRLITGRHILKHSTHRWWSC